MHCTIKQIPKIYINYCCSTFITSLSVSEMMGHISKYINMHVLLVTVGY